MLYSEYSKKMTKIATVVNTVRRFKILIICIVAVLLVVAATLMGTRGLVYDSVACPSEIPYGTDFTYRAGAFLNGVEYEFCEVGSSDWTSEKPIRAGRYYVRAVSERTFGAKSYGKVYEFAIVPKPTKITVANNVLFGELPDYSAELVYGDTISISEFVYADVSKTATQVKAKLESVSVTDIDGNDVTDSYAFVSEYSDIAFTPREIEITVPDANGVYDGLPLTSSAWELTGGTLADGDGIVTVFDKSQTDAGSTENTPIINVTRAVLNADGADVTANYKITQKIGKLTVEKREILVNTLDGTHVYDDTAFTNPQFELAEGYSLVGSDMLVAAVAQSITDVGETDNKILFEVRNAAGDDVTYNYSIVVSPGTLSVTKREVNMVSADAQKVYDGTPLINAGYRMDGTLALGHSFTVTDSAALTDVGSVFNALTGVVYGVDGVTDKSDNYEFVWQYGTLTVFKRKVKVKTADAEWFYDGYKHSHSGNFTVVPYDNDIENTGLVSGHRLTDVSSVEVIDVVRGESGEALGVDNTVVFRIIDGGNDYTDNYDIEVVAGTLLIKPREITLQTASREWMYDNAYHTDNGYELIDGSLADNQAVNVSNSAVVKDVMLDNDGNVTDAANDMDVSVIVCGSSDLFETTNDVTDNYNITLELGRLKITKRYLLLYAIADMREYNGESLKSAYDGCSTFGGKIVNGEIVGGLLDGHAYDAPYLEYNAVDAGKYDLVIDKEKVIIYDSQDRESANVITHNYDIECIDAVFEIVPRSIYVLTESATWEYDGKEYVHDGFELCASHVGFITQLVPGHSLKVTNATAATDVTRGDDNSVLSIDNVLSFEVVGTKQSNYDINVKYGKLTVTPRPITVTTASNTWVYDGERKIDFGFNITDGELVEGHTARCLNYYPVLTANVMEQKNRLDITIRDEKYVTSTDNYEIAYVYGTISITPRTVYVKTLSLSMEYDGKSHSFPHAVAEPRTEFTGIVDGYGLRVLRKTTFVKNVMYDDDGNVVGVKNEMELGIIDADGNTSDSSHFDYSKNYIIEINEYGILTVTPRPIAVKAADTFKVFNGLEQCPDYEITSGSIADGQSGEVQVSDGYIYVGEYLCSAAGIKVYSGNEETTKNYSVTVDAADCKFVITKRPITLASHGTEDDDRYYFEDYWYYDGTEKSFEDFGVLAQSDENGNPHSEKGLCFKRVDGAYIPVHRPISDDGSFSVRIDAGTFENRFTAKLFEIAEFEHDGEPEIYGKDVTYCYDITYVYGELFIMPRPITVQAGSAEKIYDGMPLTCDDYSIVPSDDPKMFALVSGQSIAFKFTPESIRTDVGFTANEIAINSIVISADGKNVMHNYEITVRAGGLTVYKREITVTTDDRFKVYDGMPLVGGGATVNTQNGDIGLITGHTVYFGSPVSITEVSESGTYNAVAVDRIVDGNGRDVTDNYSIAENFGILTVMKRILVIETSTNEWDYDGVSHSDMRFEILEGSVVSGQTLEAVACTEITNPGTVDNELSFEVYSDGIYYTDNYEIRQKFGTLTIIPPDEPMPPDPPDPPQPEDPIPIINVKSEITGSLYLRSNGYGVYNGTTDWGASPEYNGQKINYNGSNYSVNYLASIALKNAGFTAYSTEIEVLHSQFMSVIPYYTALEYGPAYGGDIGYVGTEKEYGVMQYLYNYTDDNGAALSSVDLGIYKVVEQAYREYVYATYLDVPSATAEYMNGVIAARKLNRDDPEVIEKVAKYIKSSAKYDLEYDTALDDTGDVAVAFLETYKEGVCRHYATSATLLYRTLGIPARYTVGALCDAEAGEWVEVTSDKAHAWVEVYIDGIGWINVEVTGGGFGGGAPQPPEEVKGKIAIKPVDVEKEYTGEEIFADQTVEDATGGDITIGELIDSGYSYTVVISGSRVDIGTTVSMITEFRLFDPSGNDVTDKYVVQFNPGMIRVTKTQILIYMPTYSKMYDGTPLKFEELYDGEYGYYWLELPHGVSDVLIDMTLYGGITDVGGISGASLADEFEKLDAFTVLSDSGANVTDNYTVVFASGGLTVEKREIRLTAGSREKLYDGTELTCDDYSISLGSLVAGHGIDVVMNGSITDIGETSNMIVSCVITDAEGNDVTDNYSIKAIAGTLTVK